MSPKRISKVTVFALSLIIVSPLILLAWIEKILTQSEAVYVSVAQLLSMVPGPVGSYLRSAYYFCTLEKCAWEVHVGFGSLLNHRGARLARNVSMGAYCVIGHANIESEVRMASHISIPSGKRQHLDEGGQLMAETHYDRVSIGQGSWLGEGAIIMADVGSGSIVSAGAVVIKDVPPASIVGGNPAKVLRTLDSTRGEPGID